MEPAKEPMRLRLVLGKFRVVDLRGQTMKVALGGSTTMTCQLPDLADVREGDLLTLYTEVLVKAKPDANPLSPPIQ